MVTREAQIAQSIVYSILNTDEDGHLRQKSSILGGLAGRFYLYWLTFKVVRPDLFSALRGFWTIKEDDFQASFGSDWKTLRREKKDHEILRPLGDMGYSGSTFYRTRDSAYLIKSVPRYFEHTFFKNDMLIPYADHMRANHLSLLVRITSFLECSQRSIGTLLGLAPSHHIVMENILYGQDDASKGDDDDNGPESKWESWDLKPMSYFYPERDIANGALTSEATKSKLSDEFGDKIRLSLDQAEEFKAQLQRDTKLLADCNAVDYSLFLVRVSSDVAPDPASQPELADDDDDNDDNNNSNNKPPIPPAQPPFAPPGPPTWRTGITSSDGREVYRAAVLDFFWAKHTAHAKAMTGLIKGYNLVDQQGPMSLTADPQDYRERFLRMCIGYVEVADHPGWGRNEAEATDIESSIAGA